MLSRALSRVRELLVDGTRVPAVPPAIGSIALDGDAPLGEYLELDDSVLWNALAAWRTAADPVLSDLTSRLLARRLFKTYELYGEQAQPRDRLTALETARAIATEAGLDAEIYVGLDIASDVPFDDANEPLMVMFPRGVPQRPGDVSFLLGRLRGEKVERVRLIFAPELRERIVQALAR